jgi:ubiquitin thioesterase protein OTUB1
MVSARAPPSELEEQYLDNPMKGFVEGVRYIAGQYSSYRAIRGDGNCFYRAFLFAYLEILLGMHASGDLETRSVAENELMRMLSVLEECKGILVAFGYAEIIWEDFHSMLEELLTSLFQRPLSEPLEGAFQENADSDYYIWFMRLLTAVAIKQQADRFLPFVDSEYNGIHDFVSKEIEPMGRECEHVQITALTELLRVPVRVEYLDGRPVGAEGLGAVEFQGTVEGEGSATCPFQVTLLYCPGHYQILYKD